MKNNSGISIVVVMAALVVVGFVGTSLLQMAKNDRVGGTLYSHSESARQAASSGLIAAISYLGSANPADQATILANLNKYAKANNPDTISDESAFWIKGGSSTWESLSSEQRYRVKIDGFNATSFEIALVSEGEGSGGSKATAMAVYKLKNLGYPTTTSTIPRNALQMDNGAFEFNVNLKVNGNMSVKSGFTMNDGYLDVNGRFRQDSIEVGGVKSGGTIVVNNQPMEIDSQAYFAGPLNIFSTTTFKSSVGMDGKVQFPSTNPMVLQGDTIMVNNGVHIDGSSKINLGGKTLRAYETGASIFRRDANSQSQSSHCFTNYVGGGEGEIDILPALNLSSEPDPYISFDTSKLGTPHKVFSAGNVVGSADRINGDSLNAWFNDIAPENLLGGKFMVVRVTGTCWANGIFKADASKFNGKAIIWVDDGKNIVNEMVNTTSSANLSFYINRATTTNTHFKGATYMRGFVYVNKTTTTQFYFTSTGYSHFVGGVYGSSESKFQFNGGAGKTREITYDSNVINELAAVGVFEDPTSSTATDFEIIDGYTKIDYSLLSRAM